MERKQTEVTHREERGTAPRERVPATGGPFRMLERFADEMARVFDDFGIGRGWLAPRRMAWRPFEGLASEMEAWAPEVEVLRRDHELVVRADVPGLTREDVKIEIAEDGLTIRGERKRERTEEHGGVYRSERSYGSFCRVIPLPEGVNAEMAKANLKDGVLEITMPAPAEQARRGRRVEITEERSKK